MKQKINLLNSLPSVKKTLLPCIELRKFCIYFLVGLVLYSIFVYWQDTRMQKKYHALVALQKSKVIEMTSLSKKLPLSLKATDNELKRLSDEVDHHQKLITIMQDKKGTNTQGFSALFMSLSKHITPSTWLTHIKIKNSGRYIELEGKSFTTKKVFLFLNRLDDEQSLEHVQFKLANLEATTDDKGQIIHEFTMETAHD